MTQVEQIAPGWTSLKGVEWSWTYLLSWYLLVTVAYSTRLVLLTKVLAARDHRVARFALPWTLLIVMIFLLFGGLYIGGAARILVWDEISNPDQAFPALVTLATSPILTALALTRVAAAIMSTTDSLLLMSGAAVAHDLLRRSFDQPRGKTRPEQDYLRISRLTIIVIGILAFIGSIPDVALILEIVAFALSILGSTFFVPLVAGIVWPRTSRAGATAASIGGGLVAMIFTAAALSGVQWAQVVHPMLPGLASSLVLLIGVSVFTSPVESRVGKAFFSSDLKD
jgi:sodium/proline symporter